MRADVKATSGDRRRGADYYRRKYDREFAEAMEHFRLPVTPEVIGRIAQLMMLSISTGLNLTVREVSALVKEEERAGWFRKRPRKKKR